MSPTPPAVAMRARVESAGGQLVGPAESLVQFFGYERLTPESLDGTRDQLRAVAVAVGPLQPPSRGETEQQVTLTLLQAQRQGESVEEPHSPTATASAVEAAASSAVSFAAVATGVIVTGLVFAAIGFAGHWIYGLLYLGFTALTLGLLRWRLPWIFRRLVPHVGFLRIGWLLGAVAMLTVALLASVLVMGPIAAVRGAQADEREAKRELALASSSIDKGDLDDAREHLDRAKKRNDGLPGIRDVEGRLEDEAEAREEERNASAYRSTVEEMRNDEYRQAIDGMAGLAGYRDAAQREDAFRATASRETVRRAHRGIGRSPTRALSLAREANGYRSTPATRRTIRQAREAVRAKRARARQLRRERAVRRAEARRQRRLEAKQRQQVLELARQQRELERQQQRELQRQPEEELYEPPADGGSPGCLGPESCPGKRDGDGDGCYCE